ncbi:MAG: serine/threonine protein kinase, partial [Bacteroidales bacterium]
MAERRRLKEYIGSTLGSFRILKRIGSGGMGTVFLARDITLERDVALKVISPQLARNPVLMNRFRVEAIAQAKLNHNSIVTIHTFNKDDTFDKENETYYFVMEYVDGTTLKKHIEKNGPLPISQALKIFSQILEGMAYAHARGVIHRDIKPANIFLNSHHIAKIGDFGIAKVEGIDGLTRVGSTMGSPMYSAPEQLMGQSTDARSDIYSLGMTLYEMLTGTPPVKIGGDSGVDNVSQAAEAVPAQSREVNPAIPEAVDTVIMKSIAKAPAARFQSVKEFKCAIDTLLWPLTPIPDTLSDQSTPLPPQNKPQPKSWKVPSQRKLRQIAATLGAVLVLLIVYLLMYSTHLNQTVLPGVISQDQKLVIPLQNPKPVTPTQLPILPQPTRKAADQTNTLSQIKKLIRNKQYQQAINMGEKKLTSGESTSELLQLMAMACFYDGNKPGCYSYIDKIVQQSKLLNFSLLFENKQKRYTQGTLTVSGENIAFVILGSPGSAAKTLLSLPFNQIRDAYDDKG